MQDTGRRPSWFSSLFGRSGGNPAQHSASGRSVLTGAPANITGVAANVTLAAAAADDAGGVSSDESARKTNCLAEVKCKTRSNEILTTVWLCSYLIL